LRDKIARVEDESIFYVLPNHMMLKICTELPREMQGILACCNPVPPLVKQNLGTLHSILLAAREKQLMAVDPALISSPTQAEMADFTSNILQSPLDLSHLEEAGELETVVKNKFTFANNNLVKRKPDLSVFASTKPVTTASLVQFVSPYQRYTLLKPYLDSLEKQQGDANDNTEKNGVANNENVRMDSIKKHFEKLTEMTPKRVDKKAIVEEDEEEEVALSSDEEVEPKKPYFEDPKKPYVESTERIPNMRLGAQKSQTGRQKPDQKKGNKQKNNGCFKCGEDGHFARECNSGDETVEKKPKKKAVNGGGCFKCEEVGHFARECSKSGETVENKQKKKGENVAEGHKKKKNLKRKGGEPNVVKEEKVAKTEPKFDYNQVDYKHYGSKNNQNKDFDPNNPEKDQTKFVGGGKKKQQFNKRGSKSHTFKRS